jgi:hypothetical protein
MDAKVDVRQTDGPHARRRAAPGSSPKTATFDEGRAAADADVNRIIAANLGPAARRGRTATTGRRPGAGRPAAGARRRGPPRRRWRARRPPPPRH